MTAAIRAATHDDAAAIAALYNPYVIGTSITFETQPVDASTMAGRVADVQAAGLPWLVMNDADALLGYAYATPWRARAAYRHSVETTVYIREGLVGQGHGRTLYSRLMDELARAPVHAVIAGIALPNKASIALHECMGFHKVAHFEQVGCKFNRWVDVGYWQRLMPGRESPAT